MNKTEWIGPAVVSYIAKELILGYRQNKKITRLLDQFEFVIVPVINADGYVYTWEHNRMWRKNRQPTSIPMCPGIVSEKIERESPSFISGQNCLFIVFVNSRMTWIN